MGNASLLRPETHRLDISQFVVPAKAGTQWLGMSFDKLRACPGLDPGTNELTIKFLESVRMSVN